MNHRFAQSNPPAFFVIARLAFGKSWQSIRGFFGLLRAIALAMTAWGFVILSVAKYPNRTNQNYGRIDNPKANQAD